jgi:hypothetical protein
MVYCIWHIVYGIAIYFSEIAVLKKNFKKMGLLHTYAAQCAECIFFSQHLLAVIWGRVKFFLFIRLTHIDILNLSE